MTRRRWIADEVNGNQAALTGAHAAHLARVLRASKGQTFEIATDQEVRLGRITSISEGRVEFELGELVLVSALRPIRIALAVFKFDRFEWAIEKCTELGVTAIVPLIVRRTDTHLAAAAGKRVERWRRIARESSQQSRRTAPPDIPDPVKLKEYLPGEETAQKIVLDETEQQVELSGLIRGEAGVALAAGPEGGWTEDELGLFHCSGWTSASLGATILRSETAAIAAVAITSSLREPRT